MLWKESKAQAKRVGCETRKMGLWAPGDIASSWEGARDLLSKTVIPEGHLGACLLLCSGCLTSPRARACSEPRPSAAGLGAARQEPRVEFTDHKGVTTGDLRKRATWVASDSGGLLSSWVTLRELFKFSL